MQCIPFSSYHPLPLLLVTSILEISWDVYSEGIDQALEGPYGIINQISLWVFKFSSNIIGSPVRQVY